MAKKTTISHPIIKSYIDEFVIQNEISKGKAKDEHAIFEQFVNDLMLSIYSNDPSVTYQDMETSTSFGIDGIAIFVSDHSVTSIEDFECVIEEINKFEVSFIFTQSKTSKTMLGLDIAENSEARTVGLKGIAKNFEDASPKIVVTTRPERTINDVIIEQTKEIIQAFESL